MPDFHRPAARRWRHASFAGGLAAACACAAASDHAAPAPAAAVSAKPAAASVLPPSPAHAADSARDPLDLIRERLAAKLGAARPPDSRNPNLVRVVAKAGLADGPAAPHRSATNAARSATAPLAAGERSTTGVRDAAMASLQEGHATPHPTWSYAGSGGPDAWGRMNAEFATCSSGTRQSPIDIRDGIRVELDAVQFDYKPSAFRVVDNGHTVQVNVGPGNSIEVMGRRYELLQFHFHRPSEERINGRLFDMVAHLVHKDIDGRLAVIAVLLERGGAQPIVQSVWNNLPLEKGDEVAARAPLDLNGLLPAERSYYTYMGSLTTPPCSEGVLWMVMKNPVPISPEQIGIFARLYPMNARPIQSASGRLIKESN